VVSSHRSVQEVQLLPTHVKVRESLMHPSAVSSSFSHRVWLQGSSSTSAANFGTRRVASSTSSPGSRNSACGAAGLNGELWLVAGAMYNGVSNNGDLWKYDTNTSLWSWQASASGGGIPNYSAGKGVALPGSSTAAGGRRELAWY
jgi:hypothetical protein